MSDPNNHQQRTLTLQKQLQPSQLLLISDPSDVHYYTSFVTLVPDEREAFVALSPTTCYLIHSSFSPLPADCTWLSRLTGTSPESLLQHLRAISQAEKISTISFDADTLFVVEHQALSKTELSLSLFDCTFIKKQRSIKDHLEQTYLRQAAHITHQALTETIAQLQVGQTELEVMRFLNRTMENLGATGIAFPTIVAFGNHTALPHYQPSATVRLESESAVLIDVGATVNNYCADMTRTTWFGAKPPQLFRSIEQTVHEAYQAALSVLQQGKGQQSPLESTAREVDTAARQVIHKAGYGEYFTHTTGHGVGINIHEFPSLSWKNEYPIKSGMTVTIEPGIYLDGKFGYRYENTVLVSDTGAEELL
ncbi:M24 family metallopeptidase [Candidatus Woesebacteria bacterium]|nr:M24 family metallopeptidase [Candidatus Woesebacteria bacterium]